MDIKQELSNGTKVMAGITVNGPRLSDQEAKDWIKGWQSGRRFFPRKVGIRGTRYDPATGEDTDEPIVVEREPIHPEVADRKATETVLPPAAPTREVLPPAASPTTPDHAAAAAADAKELNTKQWCVYLLESMRISRAGVPNRRDTYTGKVQTRYLDGESRWETPDEAVKGRLNEHNGLQRNGQPTPGKGKGAKSTTSMRPLRLVAYISGFTRNKDADHYERAVKQYRVGGSVEMRIQRKVRAFCDVLARGWWLRKDDPKLDYPLVFNVVRAEACSEERLRELVGRVPLISVRK